MTGTAFDADSGISRVRVRVQQLGITPRLYWNGNVWSESSAYPDVNLSENATTWTLPNVDLTNPGNYRIQIYAYDNAGNVSTSADNPRTGFAVGVADSELPVAEATSPANASSMSPNTVDITGTAFDADSGISRVRVRVQQLGITPRLYWNGNAWTESSAYPDATVNENGTAWTLPGVDLTNPGNYRIHIYAYDNAGNIATSADNPRTGFSTE